MGQKRVVKPPDERRRDLIGGIIRGLAERTDLPPLAALRQAMENCLAR